MDDGSSDNTESLVSEWKNKSDLIYCILNH